MSSKKEREQEKQEAIAFLREKCPPGTTIHTIVTRVSASGMSRDIVCFIVGDDRLPWNISGYVAKALGYQREKHGVPAVRVSGCGMDMGFHVVNSLSYALHGHGPDNDRGNGHTIPTITGGFARPGYTLNHRWL